MIKKLLAAVIFIALIFSLSGCWSSEEPKHLAIINSVVYDFMEDGGYKVIVEFMNPSASKGSKDSSSGVSPNIVEESQGDDIRTALAGVSENVEKLVYATHAKVRFFTESIATSGLADALDFFSRDHLTTETPLMVVLKASSPEELYTAKLGLEDSIGNYIEHLSQYQNRSMSQAVFITGIDFKKDYYREGKEPVMGLAELVESKQKSSDDTDITGDKEELMIRYKGLAAFRGDQLAGFMDGIETRSYNFLSNKMKTDYITVDYSQGSSVLEVVRSKAKIKPNVDGDSVAFDVNIRITTQLVSQEGDLDITKEGSLGIIEDAFSEKITREIGECIQKAQLEFGSDIFGFGNCVHMEYPKVWNDIKGNWYDYFKTAPVSITVQTSIVRTGEFKEPFIREASE